MAQQSPTPAGRDPKGRFLRGNKLSVGNKGQSALLTLNPELRQQIVESIRGGSFDWVAARANGIPARTFYHWMERGESGEAEFAEFWQAVQTARAESRLAAEQDVKRKEPLAWLMKGPGRDRPGEPGWTDRPAQQEMPHLTIIVTNNWKV
jgi:hypothetical protein